MALNLLGGIPGIGGSFGGGFGPSMLQLLMGPAVGASPFGMPQVGIPGLGFGFDGFNPSGDLFDRGGGSMPSFLLGNQFGVGGGQGLLGMSLPGMGGFGGFPGAGGFGGFPGMGGFGGFPGMGGFPSSGGFGGGFGNPLSSGGGAQQMMMMGLMLGLMMGLMQRMSQGNQGSPIGMGGPGQGQGGVHELKKGESFTTRGGATINWQGDQVKVQEPGGGGRSLGAGGTRGAGGPSQAAFSLAGQFGPQGFSLAMAGAFAGAGGPTGNAAASGAEQARPRDWMVHGDPHIKNPDGSNLDYNRNGGLFTLQDGTRVQMEADGPGQVVKRVLIFDPGAQLGGFDPNKTTDYGNGADGKFRDMGSVAQTLGQGGFQSPFGNNLFGF